MACSLLKLDGSWQATPSITKFLNLSQNNSKIKPFKPKVRKFKWCLLEEHKLQLFIFQFQAINFASKLFLAPSPSRLTRITLNLVENKRKWGLKRINPTTICCELCWTGLNWLWRSFTQNIKNHATSFLPYLRCKKCIRRMIINTTFIFTTDGIE